VGALTAESIFTANADRSPDFTFTPWLPFFTSHSPFHFHSVAITFD